MGLIEFLFGIKEDSEPIDKDKPVSWFALGDKESEERQDRIQRERRNGRRWS